MSNLRAMECIPGKERSYTWSYIPPFSITVVVTIYGMAATIMLMFVIPTWDPGYTC